VLFFFVHLAARRLLRVLAGTSSVAALEVENAVLRHQLAVLGRTVSRQEAGGGSEQHPVPPSQSKERPLARLHKDFSSPGQWRPNPAGEIIRT